MDVVRLAVAAALVAASALLLAVVAWIFASRGPFSFRSAYRRAVNERLAREEPAERVEASASPSAAVVDPSSRVTEDDVHALPEPVRRYLRLSGAIGRPRVHRFRAAWRGRIRGGPADPWMSFHAEQHNFVRVPARFFHMKARRNGLPVDILHTFARDAATMRVRLLSLVPLVDASGPQLDRAETVTLLNDLCVLAPGALIDPSIEWEAIDADAARARYTVGENTVEAVLHFEGDGRLVDFVSDDRLAASADGRTFERRRWSTPLSDYRDFGPWRLAGRGKGRWQTPEGAYDYIELELLELDTG